MRNRFKRGCSGANPLWTVLGKTSDQPTLLAARLRTAARFWIAPPLRRFSGERQAPLTLPVALREAPLQKLGGAQHSKTLSRSLRGDDHITRRIQVALATNSSERIPALLGSAKQPSPRAVHAPSFQPSR
jgi:hypothetical protein